MGHDKARMLIDGEAMEERAVRLLSGAGWPVTVLGPRSVAGAAWQADQEPGSGALASLGGFQAEAGVVFVVSCDVPGICAAVADALAGLVGGHEAVVPVLGGRRQPLCAVYTRGALGKIAPGEARVTAWVSQLDVLEMDEEGLTAIGVEADWVRSANSVEEMSALTGRLGLRHEFRDRHDVGHV